MDKQTILKLLPYSEPFLFVDTLEVVTDDEVVGYYTYPEDAFFYRGHFKDHPVTPGVILTETMAQIGLVCMGIYLLRDKIAEGLEPGLAFSSQEVDYYKAVYPGEKVKVQATKEYFRFGKLKCKVEMHNAAGELVCKGVLAGMGRV
ncbi:3-hydroxyacyl-ACP dehydratase FabZ family protein [Lewinella sp. LCG006]|uniref:3-hydroxyacyl-ACP dehydratase FabZ family protein n=1 Tax=Lewinella sp. LCG006 TaxID=3231911 RepID=UPI00345F1EC6